MTNQDEYLYICKKLYLRYATGTGIVLGVAGNPSKYQRLLDMAAVKYLGCDPDKLKGSY